MVREATKIEISLAVAMRLTRDHEDVEKDAVKAKVNKQGFQKQFRRC